MGNALVKIGLKSKPSARFLIVGLDAAGKTTMLCTHPVSPFALYHCVYADKAQLGEVVTTIPTSATARPACVRPL